MSNDSVSKATAARKAYEARPWLKHYPNFIQPEITPQFANALEMLLATVQAMPEQPAMYYFDRAISYGELDRASSALAFAFKTRGIGYGDRIALYLQNIPQFLIGMYASWKVGAIVVPCNPMYKQHELEFHLNDSGARGLICLESLFEAIVRDVIDNTRVELIITTSELDFADQNPVPILLRSSRKRWFDETLDLLELLTQYDGKTVEFVSLTPQDIAVLTYTSGTTGQPKGAMNTHANVVFNATCYQQWMQLDNNDVVIGVAPMYIHNIYRLTETTSPSHAVPLGVRAPVDPVSGALSVGVPIPNTICRVIDVANDQDLPPGTIGELVTKGPEIVAGYWKKPEETAHAIRDGYFYTGDVAKMDEDGWFYLVDRKKDMISASGFKVWPREVEDVLYQHPAVREAGVVGAPDPYRGETVIAYVSLKSGFENNVTSDELIDFCKQRLANYKYPRQIEILEELPKTPSGKFLRRELRNISQQL